MRGVERVPDQHVFAVRPAFVAHARELPPDRTIGDQRMPFKVFREHLLANLFRLGFAHARETGA